MLVLLMKVVFPSNREITNKARYFMDDPRLKYHFHNSSALCFDMQPY